MHKVFILGFLHQKFPSKSLEVFTENFSGRQSTDQEFYLLTPKPYGVNNKAIYRRRDEDGRNFKSRGHRSLIPRTIFDK